MAINTEKMEKLEMEVKDKRRGEPPNGGLQPKMTNGSSVDRFDG